MSQDSVAPMIPAVFDRVKVQARVAAVLAFHIQSPSNSYLFLGPPGSGKKEWALAFAAGLMCAVGGCGACSTCASVMAGNNPDLNVFSNRDGSLSVDDARQAIRYSVLSPSASLRRVVVLEEFENIARVAPVLLKAIEEPPASTVFILSASVIGKDMMTIASRCVKVDFAALQESELANYLAWTGVRSEEASLAAQLARGSVARAVALVDGGYFAGRYELWRGAATTRYQNGAELMAVVGEIIAFIDAVTATRKAQGEERLSALKEAAKRSSGTKGAIRELEADLARELRFGRRNEFELGFAILLSCRNLSSSSSDVDLERGSLDYQTLDEQVHQALRQLRAGISEPLVLATLLGGTR